MNDGNLVLAGLKPRELQPRLELQLAQGCYWIREDCGCGFADCCPYPTGTYFCMPQ
jgi:hypothetical protein